MFEIKYSDLAGRIGILHTNHGKIETPSFVPVIHPVKQSIPAKKIKEIGFDVVITNAYITMKRLEEKARENGIHKIIKYDSSIMTDSGGYQVGLCALDTISESPNGVPHSIRPILIGCVITRPDSPSGK